MRAMFLFGLVLCVGCGASARDLDAIEDGEQLTPRDDTPDDRNPDDRDPDDTDVGDPIDLPGGPMGVLEPSDEPAFDPDRTFTYYADTKAIFDGKCTGCHFDGGIGPMPLTTYTEIMPFLSLIEHDVDMGVMPPWTANVPLNFFAGDRRLSDVQKQTMLAWIEQGAPEGDSGDEPNLVVDEPTERALARVDLSLSLPEPYVPQLNPDDYRCFVIEWPHQATKYITGIDFVPDQTQLVHHAIVYHVQPEGAQSARDRDAAEAGPGYTCFGATGVSASWLQSYEPGGYGQSIPGNLGFEVRPGSVMVLQIHYNTLHGIDADQSVAEFTLEDTVDRVGEVVLIMNGAWPAGGMEIPANAPDVMFTHRGRGAGISQNASYDIYWVDLHMHQLGSGGRIGIIRADQPDQLEGLLDIPEWQFNWQETYLLRDPIVFNPGDQLYVECHFDNTAENQVVVNGERLVPRDVNWGDGTTDEMCLGNVLVAER